MATSIQFLRSPVASLRPDPNTLEDGMPMVNTHESDPGLYFRLRNQTLCKIGPTSVGPQPPNQGAQGLIGNAIGESWLDTSVGNVLKVWDGTNWLTANGGTSIPSLPTYADDAAAGTGGLVADDIYKTATGELRIKL